MVGFIRGEWGVDLEQAGGQGKFGRLGSVKYQIANYRVSDFRLRRANCFATAMSEYTSEPTNSGPMDFVCSEDRRLVCTASSNTPRETHSSTDLAVRNATATNYGEARAAESRSDFVHKLRIVLKELNETFVWLQVIGGCSLVHKERIRAIVAENQELCRIIGASVRTARARKNRNLETCNLQFEF
jgi:four helix bundle protein